MYFTKLKLSSEQLELMILTIDLEYTYSCEDDLADLIANNYNLPLIDVLYALRAYNSCKEEDYEQASKETMIYGEY